MAKNCNISSKTTKILTFKSVGSKDVTLNCVPYHFSSWSVCPWNFLDTTITLHISNSTLWRLVIKILYSQPKALIIIKIHFIHTFIIQLTTPVSATFLLEACWILETLCLSVSKQLFSDFVFILLRNSQYYVWLC